MPIDGRNRKRGPSPADERPAKRQRKENDVRDNVLAAYATTISPRRSRRNFVNPDLMAELGKGSTEPQRVAGDEQPVHVEEEMSVSQSTRTATPRNKRTYGRKGRPRAVHQGTANRALASPNHVDDSRNSDPGEGKEEMVELSISTKGIPRQNQRRNPAAGETHEGAGDEVMVDISHSRESPSDHLSTKNAKNASRRSRRGYDSDTSAIREPEHPPISPNNDSSKVNRLSFSPALQISLTGAQSDPSDGVDAGSTQSVEVPVSHLPERRRGRPKKSKTVPKEDSTVKEPTLAPQPITQEHQTESIGFNGKGKCIL